MNCPICLKKIKNVCTLKCNHNYCFNCIEQWAFTKETCPVCRGDFSMDDLEQKIIFTRSMSINKRASVVHNKLKEILNHINNTNEITNEYRIIQIDKIFNLFYNNLWMFKCTQPTIPKNICSCNGCSCKKSLVIHINDFEKLGWSGIKIWRYKFRDYL